MKLLTYYNTLKRLKLSQIYYRIVKRFIKPKPHKITCGVGRQYGNWTYHELYKQKIFEEDKASFLNIDGLIKDNSIWNNPKKSKLWLYNLHYFDDLNACGANQRLDLHVNLINRWINENPAPFGNGWEPYPTSLRIVNWIKAFLNHVEPSQAMLDSLAKQVDYLSQDLERHLLGNHLFVNAKALIFTGLFFEGDYADNWLATGLDIYSKELEEQILQDGGNFELTPMYHVIMLVDLLDLLNLFNLYSGRIDAKLVTATKAYAIKMLDWLDAMSHQDGKISFFNDSTFSIAPEIPVVLDYARQLGISVKDIPTPSTNELVFHDLTETGYVSVQAKDFTLIADLGEVGPSYQPGHAHADTLSYEFALHGKRLLVNSGISEYGLSDERLRQRQTAAHNTVVVDGIDSSQVWSGFRVAKRANILDRIVERQDRDTVVFAASHNGFKQQGVNCIHRRTWSVLPQRITVVDSLVGDFENAIGYLHLHPDVEIVSYSDSEIKLSVADSLVSLSVSGASISIEDSSWHPEFGISHSSKKVCFKFKNNKMNIDFSWDMHEPTG
jgi:uncharacterized heparinase superfamily protein